jgi:SAM-dependent methyltransferase
VVKQGFVTLPSAMDEADNYTRWIISLFSKHLRGRVLEVGLGHANYRNFLPDLSSYVGSDIDAGIIASARARHPSDRFILIDVCADDFPERLGRGSFDAVMCFNVLQYVRDERLAIANMIDSLRGGGALALLVPAMQSLYGRMDELAGHRSRYERVQVTSLFDELPARVLFCRFFNPIGALGWWVNNRLPHNTLEDDNIARQIRLFDRYVVPLSRAIDRLSRGFFGQSLACLATKTS